MRPHLPSSRRAPLPEEMVDVENDGDDLRLFVMAARLLRLVRRKNEGQNSPPTAEPHPSLAPLGLPGPPARTVMPSEGGDELRPDEGRLMRDTCRFRARSIRAVLICVARCVLGIRRAGDAASVALLRHTNAKGAKLRE